MAREPHESLCTVTCPLGDDVFVLERMKGRESISEPFRFELDLLSEDRTIPFEQVIGRSLHVLVRLPGGGERHFDGIVSRLALTGEGERQASYRAELVPRLWLLTRGSDCRIFQHKSVPEIVSLVLEKYDLREFHFELVTREPREYCVQYRESDFAFVSRLLEEEGISYYFEHGKDFHRLLFFDSAAGLQRCPHLPEARYTGGKGDPGVQSFSVCRELRAGTATLRDFDFTDPDLDTTATKPGSMDFAEIARLERYDYPGGYSAIDDGDERAKRMMESEETASVEIRATSNQAALTPGFLFDLRDHFREDCNGTHLVTSVEHEISEAGLGSSEDSDYRNRFGCIPARIAYRERIRTPKPVIQGAQTATVVGGPGKEIDVDRYGRVVVQFHWDREGQRNAQSSCRVRVAQNWAGNRWGAAFHPRVGQEVIVEFLEGDPDRPIVTGRVYNGKQMPPYDLPANATVSGVKSRSSEGGDRRTFNEIRMEDKKGSEELYIHAEKDQNVVVENDRNEDVGHDETQNVQNDRKRFVGHDESLRIGNDQELILGHDQIVQIGNNGSVSAENQVRIVVGKSSLTLNKDGTIILDGAKLYLNGREISLRGTRSLTYNADTITGVGRTDHVIRGATVRHNP